MSGPTRVAAVLRQPTLAAEPRVPAASAPARDAQGFGHAVVGFPQGAAAREDASEQTAAPLDSQIAAPAPDLNSPEFEQEVERRAALAAASLIEQQRAAWTAQAREEGYADGVQSGRDAVEREWAALAARAQAVLEGVKAACARESQASADLAMHLTFASLRKLLGEAFASSAGAQAAIANALSQVGEQSVVVLRVAPKDAVILAGTSDATGLFGALPSDVAIEADERIAPGGCVIETQRGALDARIESQLEGLLAAIREAYDSRVAVPGTGAP